MRCGIAVPGVLDQRIKRARFDSCRGVRATIGQSRSIAAALTRDIFIEPSALLFPNCLQIAVVEGCVKREPRGVQLMFDCEVELLLSDQHFNISASKRVRNCDVEQRLR